MENYYYILKEEDLYKYVREIDRSNFITMFNQAEKQIKVGLKEKGLPTEINFKIITEDQKKNDIKNEAIDNALDLLVKIINSDLDVDAYDSLSSSIVCEPLLDINERLLDSNTK